MALQFQPWYISQDLPDYGLQSNADPFDLASDGDGFGNRRLGQVDDLFGRSRLGTLRSLATAPKKGVAMPAVPTDSGNTPADITVGNGWRNTFPTLQQPSARQAAPASGGTDWGDKLAGLASSLAAAQGFFSGDPATATAILANAAAARRQNAADLAAAQQHALVVRALIAKGMDPATAQAAAGVEGVAKQVLAPDQEKPDEFHRMLSAAGVDPASPQAQQLANQWLATHSSPQPQFVSDGMGGGRWMQPPAPIMPGAGAPQSAGAMGGIPAVSDEASYNALPPGTQYRTPDGHIRVKGGGAGNGAGGFPSNIPSGNPLAPYGR